MLLLKERNKYLNFTFFQPHQEDISAIGQSLLLCENSLCDQLDWRIYCTFLEQLEVLPFCYSSDFIYTCFLDHLMNRVTTVVRKIHRHGIYTI